MTDKTMTLEQVRDYHQLIAARHEAAGTDQVAYEMHLAMRDAIDERIKADEGAMGDAADLLASRHARQVPDGWKLAMWVLQSELFHKLPEEERAVCEALIAENPYIAAPPAPSEEVE